MAASRRSLLALLLGLVTALGVASCGGGESAELLPGSTASEISSNLDEVQRLADEGECVGAQDAALAVSDQVDALGGVDRQLKQALREGADRLNEVVAACEETGAEEEEAEPPVTETTEVEAEEAPEKDKPEKKEPPGQEKKAEKEAEEAEEPETTEPTTPTPPAEPPAGDGGTPSGGVSPGAPAGEE